MDDGKFEKYAYEKINVNNPAGKWRRFYVCKTSVQRSDSL